MRQVVQDYATGKVRVQDVPLPAMRAGGLLVGTRVSLVSAGTERQALEFGRSSLVAKARSRPDLVEKVLNKARTDGVVAAWESARSRLEEWTPLGYSSAGVVLSVGPGCEGFKVGDRVACAGAGFANHAEVAWVPQNLAVTLPAGLGFDEAAFATVGAVALHGIHRAQVGPGDRVAVLGLGLLGQLTVQVLAAYGNPVFGIDTRPEALALASKMGGSDGASAESETLESQALAFTDGLGMDAVIITASTPSNEPLAQAARIARRGGRVCVVGLVGMDADRRVFYDKELQLVVAKSYGPGRGDPGYELQGIDYPPELSRWTIARNLREFLRLAADGRVRTAPLVADRVPLEGVETAYERLLNGELKGGTFLIQYPAQKAGLADGPMMGVAVPRAPPEAAPATRPAVGLAVIGAGAFARGVLLPALAKAGPLDRRFLVAATGTSAGYAARKFGFAAAGTDVHAALGDPMVRAVIIATRHDLHARLARDALRAGKDVFVEKPLALNEPSLKEVLDAAAASGRLQVGFNRRFAPLVRRLVAHFQPRSGPLLMTYRVNAGRIPADHWTREPREGGGRILGEVCHFVDALQVVAGALPVRVHASGGGTGVEAQDHLAVTLDFAEGSRGVILYGAFGPPTLPKERLEVFGQGRSAVLDNFRRLELQGRGPGRSLRSFRQDKGHVAELQAFFAAVRSSGPAPVPLREIAASSLATLAIPRSLADGKPTSLVVGDAPATPEGAA